MQVVTEGSCATEGCSNEKRIESPICSECAGRLNEEKEVLHEGDDDPEWRGRGRRTKYIQVLCQCGWGNLKMKLDDAPEHCPLCGYCFEPDDAF